MKRADSILWIVLALLFLTSCGGSSGTVAIRIGVLPTLDALPLHVSLQAQAFQAQNVDLALKTFQSAREITEALTRGELDAALVDLPSALLLCSPEGSRARIVRLAMQATPERAMYVIVARRGNPVATAKDLSDKTLAIPAGLGHRYAADRLLALAGVNPATVKQKEVADPMQGIDLLRKGEVAAALLPEVLTWGSLSRETRLLTAPASGLVGETVLVASRKLWEQDTEGLKRFMVAYEAGVRAILFDPELFRPLVAETGWVPHETADQFPLPPYALAQLPTQSALEEANQWLVGQGLLTAPVAYNRLATDAFLPDPSLVEQALFCH